MASEQRKLQSVNPHTGELIKEFDFISDEELERKLDLAANTFKTFRDTSFEQRTQWMNRVAELLEENAEKYGEIITKEMGRVYKQSKEETPKCSKWAKWYGKHAVDILKDVHLKTDSGKKTLIVYEPLGVLYQIAPFNYPFLQCLRFLTACVMAGNVAVIKHSHNTTMSALCIEELFKKAGLPEGVCQILLIEKKQSDRIITDRRIKGVTITGGVEAGRKVAKQSGEAITKHVLELGGSDAYIICDDADMDKAVQEAVKGRIVNNGESCTAAKRFVVVESRYQKFCDELTKKFKDLKMGDPMNEENDLGPLASKDLRDKVHEGVEKAVKEGAKLLCGGYIPGDKGFYYPPTVLSDVTPENPAFKEEIFGPVASIIRAKDEDDAIYLVNISNFGLGGGVFTKDEEKGERIARRLEVGLAFVNKIVTSSPEYPFGGTKDSGYGRECGEAGIKEWVNHKSLVIA